MPIGRTMWFISDKDKKGKRPPTLPWVKFQVMELFLVFPRIDYCPRNNYDHIVTGAKI